MALSVDSHVTSNITHSGTTLTVTLNTDGPNELIVLLVSSEINDGAPLITISGVSGGSGLTWARRASYQNTTTAGIQTAHILHEIWWAWASTQQTAQTITIVAAAAPDTIIGAAFGVKGVPASNAATPWDGHASLPAHNFQPINSDIPVVVNNVSTIDPTPLVIAFATNVNTVNFFNNAPAAGHTQLSYYQWGASNNGSFESEYYVAAAALANATVGINNINMRNWGAMVDAIASSGLQALAALEAPDTAAFTGTAAASSVDGSFAATESLDAATFAGSAEQIGSIAANEAADAASVAGNVITQGGLAATESLDAAAFAGDVRASSDSLVAYEAADTADFPGDASAFGALSVVEPADVVAFVIDTERLSMVAAVEAPDAASFNGGIIVDVAPGSGPFYFAWVDATDTMFDPARHAVEDERIVTFSIEHREGDVPTLSIDVKNPKVGLLAPGRQIWAWFSWDNGMTIQPLFFGRLVGIPTNMVAEVCTLAFVAKPRDYADQKQAVAETLKVRPNYDPIWIDETSRDDPDTILEGWSALWHVDRITLRVTVSDIITGEDGVEIFNEVDSFYDSVSVSLNETPLTSIAVDGTVTWTQAASGTIDFGTFNFKSYYGATAFSGWPKNGASYASGWSVESGGVSDLFNIAMVQSISRSYHWENKASHHATGDDMSYDMSASGPAVVTQADSDGKPIDPGTSFGENEFFKIIKSKSHFTTGVLDPDSDPPINTPATINSEYTYSALWAINSHLVMRYDAARSRTERVTFTLSSDLQAILTDPEDTGGAKNFETLSLNGATLDAPLYSTHFLTGQPFAANEIPGYVPSVFDPSIYLPIGDPSRRSFFPTERGLWSIEYLISLARAHLLMRSRVVEITFDCRFERALALSCRKNALLRDHRLPGGEAVGKVVSYIIHGDGDAGNLGGTVTISCAIGYGNAIVEEPGIPSYVDDGYVDDYQFYAEQVAMVGAGDTGYSPPLDQPIDDGLVFPLSPNQVLVEGPWHSTNPDEPVNFNMTLKPLDTGPFQSEYDIVVTKLVIPKDIDLEAPSS